MNILKKILSLPLLWLVIFSFTSTLQAEEERFFTDYFYQPPPQLNAKAVEEMRINRRYPMPEDRVRRYVKEAKEGWHFSEFRKERISEKSEEALAPNQIAWGMSLREKAADRFERAAAEGDTQVFLGRLRSDEARALRLRVDLKDLLPGEELWLLDGEGFAAFGPYTREEARPAGTWLPTTAGESVVIALRTPHEECPQVEIRACSHFFKSIFNPGLRDPKPCHIDASDESSLRAQESATAVGILIIPTGSSQGYCTGTLINTLDDQTSLPESHMISAYHCFESRVDLEGVEVFWDYRSEADDPNALPRSQGAALLSHSAILDAVLIKLHREAPVGDRGRAWAGWDTLQLPRQSSVRCFHYPIASSMKVSRGLITLPETSVCKTVLCTEVYEKQIQINWYEGVAEPGSSGSPLMLPDFNYRVVGMLSNGNDHSCRSSANNFDNFAAFRYFFPQIKCHLVPGASCGKAYKSEDQRCFLRRLFTLKEASLDNLYIFRERVLEKSAFGRACIEDYYAFAPEIEAWLKEDRLARKAFEMLVQGAVLWGSLLEAGE
ncbi:MAG: S1 family peptidase [Candidatus Hydrogenedens sp.]|nr:S1 family peptidase [Candidatus Hydrogenedens sp.]